MRIRISTLVKLTCVIALVVLVASAIGSTQLTVQAAGVVGTGTPDSCNEGGLDAALAGGGGITFNCGPTPVAISILKEKDITANVSINGGGLVTISGRNRARIFRVNAGASLTLNNISLAYAAANGAGNGDGGGNGAGILNEGGIVSVTDSTILNSRSEENGAAVYNKSGTMSLIRTLLWNNTAGNNGGAVGVEQGAMNIGNSTISGNFASNGGGGVFNNTGTLIITNTTIYNNNAGFGASAILNSTGGQITVKNTIIASKLAIGGVPINDNCGGGVTDGGTNLQYPDSSCGPNVPVADPVLGTLADNGGPTLTHALKQGSPAIDVGNEGICDADPVIKIDERVVTRPIGTTCDIGAYEYDPKNPPKDTTGVCVTPAAPEGTPPTTCPQGQLLNTVTQKCYIPCPPGTVAVRGQCVKPTTPTPTLPPAPPTSALCPDGKPRNAFGVCVCSDQRYIVNPDGSCGQQCACDELRNNSNQCVKIACPRGQYRAPDCTCKVSS